MILLRNLKVDVAQEGDREGLIELLSLVQLPFADLPSPLKHFFIIKEAGITIGSVGMEAAGKFALLRSLATHPDFRNIGIGHILLQEITSLAKENEIEQIFLITTSAEEYFFSRGYVKISREKAAVEIQCTSQFKGVCPSSASLMAKII